MLAWAFGALLEGLVGFGYPWAVVAPILIGLAGPRYFPGSDIFTGRSAEARVDADRRRSGFSIRGAT